MIVEENEILKKENQRLTSLLEEIKKLNKQKEEEHFKKDIFLDLIGRTAKVGGWEFDAETLQQTWTEEVYRIHEVDSSFNPNVKKAIGFYTVESCPVIEKAVNHAIEFGESFDLELEIITKKGNSRWVHAIGTAYQENGKTKKVFGSFQDITERKLVEKELYESEKRYHTLAEISPVGIFRTNDEGKTTYVNPRWSEISGLTADKAMGEGWLNAVHSEDRYLIKCGWEKATNARNSSSTEYRFVHNNGTIVWVMGNAVPEINSKNQIIGYVGTITDITEHKRAEQDHDESQRLIEGIINAIPVRVFWKDHNLKFLGCNEIFARDAGFSDPNDIVGKDDFQMVWHDQAELYRADDMYVIDTGICRFNIEEPQTTPDGKTITLLTSKIPLKNSKGEINGVLGTYIDISERKMNEEALKDKINELQRFQKLTVGRELTMIELKKEVNELLKKTGNEEKYKIV